MSARTDPKTWHPAALAALAWLACAAAPADATSNYAYGKHEYALIHGGRSPDGRYSIASHGEGELGDENFHVYLMAEPRHRKLVALPDIGEDVLDSSPVAYWAAWSKDSRHVAVSHRVNRHMMQTKLYRIEGAQARRITGPSAFTAATKRDLAEFEDDSINVSSVTVDWTGPTRFRLIERYRFRTKSPELARVLGRFGKSGEPDDKGESLVEFSAEASAELLPVGGYRILAVKPGEFEN